MLNYFDNAATRPMSRRALSKYMEAAEKFAANPSSIYKAGKDAKKAIGTAREEIANLLGVRSSSLFFTSGATESISIVFQSLLWSKEPGRVILSRIEHDAVRSFIPLLKEKGWDVVILKAKHGFVSPEDLKNALDERTRLVAIMAVNNVNGAIEDIPELCRIVREYEETQKHGIIFFSDSVQALGKAELDLAGSDIDAASFSAHKIAGPRGIGLLYLKNRNLIRPLSSAGGQEDGMRGGTENTAAILSFAEALKETYENRKEKEERIRKLSEKIRSGLAEAGCEINSIGNTTPYIINASSRLPSEVMARILDDKGISVSSGSACSNNAKKGENIIDAMGFGSKRAMGSIRISLSDDNTEEETDYLISTVREALSGF